MTDNKTTDQWVNTMVIARHALGMEGKEKVNSRLII